MATHSSVLAWEISWTEETSRLQFWGHEESDTTEWLSMQHMALGTREGISGVLNLVSVFLQHMELGTREGISGVLNLVSVFLQRYT